jgi:hypothetical protein
MIRRNLLLLAHPKWVVPRNAVVKKDSLGNDVSIVEYQGQVPPRIEAPPPMSGELFAMRKDLKGDLQQIMGVFDISRGQVPAGIKSGVAIQFLDEQENERANSAVAKHAAFIRNMVKKAIAVAGDFYEPEDERLVPVVGRTNEYMLKHFDPEVLRTSYAVRVHNTSGLPNSMVEQARRNPAYSLQLVQLPQFPVFFELGLADMIMFDAARTGNPMPLESIYQMYEQQQVPPELQQFAQPRQAGAPIPGAMQPASGNTAQMLGGPASDAPPPGAPPEPGAMDEGAVPAMPSEG